MLHKGFLDKLGPELAGRFAALLRQTVLQAGELATKQAAVDDSMFLVVDGNCDVITQSANQEDITVVQAIRGDAVGVANVLVPSYRYEVTTRAGEGGATLGLLRASQFSSLTAQAQHDTQAAQLVQAVRAAACLPVLALPPALRRPQHLLLLSHITSCLQAFESLPAKLCQQLAGSMTHVHLPAGSLVVEEDSIGDAMYAVLSGMCEIRARPTHAVSIPQQQSQPTSVVVVGPKHRHGASDSDSDTSEEGDRTPAGSSAHPARSEAEHSASFWIHKYMQQAQKLVQAAEPEHEVAGLPLPLLARAAGHWKARTQQHRHHPALTTAAAEEKPLSPLEELLGRGAAKAMALQMNLSPAAGPQLPSFEANPAAARSLANTQPTATPGSAALSAAAPPQLGHSNSPAAALQEANASAVLTHSNFPRQETAEPTNSSGRVTSPACSSEDIQRQAPAVQPAEGTATHHPAVGVQYGAEPVRGLADPNKRLLAKMGSQAPADVSKQLMQEVAARSHVDALLQEVAGQVRKHQDADRAVSRRDSFKVAQVIDHRLAQGGSSQGFGPEPQQTMGRTALDSMPEEPHSSQATGSVQEDTTEGHPGPVAAMQPHQASHSQGRFQQGPLPQGLNLDAYFGKVIRTVHAGESFGELALLQKHACRTATVVSCAFDAPGSGEATAHGVDLIKIARKDYDLTVRALQLQQLEGLLGVLHGVPPFADLSREQLISLAIFLRPSRAPKGQVIVKQGQPVDTFYLIQEGEVLLTTTLDIDGDAQSLTVSSHAGRAATPSGQISRAGSFQRSFRRSSSLTKAATQLALLGPGESFGEEVCGMPMEPDAEPRVEHDAALQGCSQQPLLHVARVTANQACSLLALSALDLARFGPQLMAEMQKYAGQRRQWRQHRLALCKTASQSTLDAQQLTQTPGSPKTSSTPLPADPADTTPAPAPAAYHDLTKRRARAASGRRKFPSGEAARVLNMVKATAHRDHKGLEVLMDHVTAVGFSSCALQHNAKLPNLALPAGLPIDAKHAQASTTRSRPSTGVSSRPQSAGGFGTQDGGYAGASSLSLSQVLAGATPGPTPRHAQSSDAPSPSPSRPASGGKPPRPGSAGGRPMSGRTRPTSATLTPIMEDSFVSQECNMSGTASPLFPEGPANKAAGSRPTSAKWSQSRAGALLTASLQEQLHSKMGKLAFAGVTQGTSNPGKLDVVT